MWRRSACGCRRCMPIPTARIAFRRSVTFWIILSLTIAGATITTNPTSTTAQPRPTSRGSSGRSRDLHGLHGAGENQLRRHQLPEPGQRRGRDRDLQRHQRLGHLSAGARNHRRHHHRGQQHRRAGLRPVDRVHVRLQRLRNQRAGHDYGDLQSDRCRCIESRCQVSGVRRGNTGVRQKAEVVRGTLSCVQGNGSHCQQCFADTWHLTPDTFASTPGTWHLAPDT